MSDDKLPIEHKHELNRKLRLEVARAIHMAQFKPALYLGDGEEEE